MYIVYTVNNSIKWIKGITILEAYQQPLFFLNCPHSSRPASLSRAVIFQSVATAWTTTRSPPRRKQEFSGAFSNEPPNQLTDVQNPRYYFRLYIYILLDYVWHEMDPWSNSPSNNLINQLNVMLLIIGWICSSVFCVNDCGTTSKILLIQNYRKYKN